MNARVCICCGEPMSVGGNPLSRNPNVCASCSSMADGMGEAGGNTMAGSVLELPAKDTRHRETEEELSGAEEMEGVFLVPVRK